MAKTTTQLALRALQFLKVVDSTESATAEDDAFVQAEYLTLVQELEFRNIGAWSETAIPEWLFVPLAKVLAARVAQDFGRDYMDEETAIAGLRKVLKKPYIGNSVHIEWM
jgi:hypothetical protein